MWYSCQYSKEERRASGVGCQIDYVRRHVISQRGNEDHVIRHVTYLGGE